MEKIKKALSKLPLKFSSNEDRNKLIKSLEKGNLQKVQMDDGQTLYAKTSPASKSVRIYDERLQPVRIMEGKEQKRSRKPPWPVNPQKKKRMLQKKRRA